MTIEQIADLIVRNSELNDRNWDSYAQFEDHVRDGYQRAFSLSDEDVEVAAVMAAETFREKRQWRIG